MDSAPINPADLAKINGISGNLINYPFVLGIEGSGIVVENGGGIAGWSLFGKRVALTSTD